MASNLLAKLNDELSTLEAQLHDFRTAVDYLTNAKGAVEDSVKAVEAAQSFHINKLDQIDSVYQRAELMGERVEALSAKIEKVDFPDRLSTIESNLQQVITGVENAANGSLKELRVATEAISKADFEGKFQKLSRALDGQVSRFQELTDGLASDSSNTSAEIQSSLQTAQTNFATLATEQMSMFKGLRLDQRFDDLDSSLRNLQERMEQFKTQLLETNLAIVNNHQSLRDAQQKQVDNVLQELKRDFSEKATSLNTAIHRSANQQRIAIVLSSIACLLAAILLIVSLTKN